MSSALQAIVCQNLMCQEWGLILTERISKVITSKIRNHNIPETCLKWKLLQHSWWSFVASFSTFVECIVLFWVFKSFLLFPLYFSKSIFVSCLLLYLCCFPHCTPSIALGFLYTCTWAFLFGLDSFWSSVESYGFIYLLWFGRFKVQNF